MRLALERNFHIGRSRFRWGSRYDPVDRNTVLSAVRTPFQSCCMADL